MAEIGTTLREARMRARIDIAEVEAHTKIRAKYLRAIENEEFDLLPGPVYVKSFLRTYGDYLGLDSRMLVDDYKRRYERPFDHDQRPIASRTRERERERERKPRGPIIPPWAAIGVVLIAVVVVLYLLGKHNTQHGTSAPTIHANTTPRPRPRTHTTTTAKLPPKPATVTLQLVPTGRIYVCLVDGKGTQLIPGQIFDAGQTIPTETKRKLLLTLGNAAVTMKVNGKAVTVTPSATAIGYEVTSGGAKPLAAAQQPRCT